MKKSFIVVGLGRFGLAIVKTLAEMKCDVLAIDNNEECVTRAAEYIQHCVICDGTKKNNLKELDVASIDHAIVAIGSNLQSTILATINLKELGVKRITVRVDEEEHATVLERLGATDVIIPEVASATALANEIVSDSILDYHQVSSEYGVVQIKVNAKFTPTSLIDLDTRNRFDVNIIGMFRNDDFFIPKGTDRLEGNDIVVVIGRNQRVTKFERFLND